jgi:hypothetical protein
MMRVERLGWLGTRTAAFEAMTTFLHETLGLATDFAEPDFAMFSLPGADHDYVELIGPEAEDSDFESEYYTTGPVVGFVVDDIATARDELIRAGVELLGDITWSSRIPGYGWFHLRAPDGNVYGMLQGSRCATRPEAPVA